MDRHNRIGLILLILAVLTASCAPLLPSVNQLPTQPAEAMSTYIAGTRDAAGTQTQLYTTPSSTPTLTRTPSRTPTITATPTATIIFNLATIAAGAPATSTKKSSSGGGGGDSGGSGDGGNADDGDKEGDLACKIMATTVMVGGNPTSKVPAGAKFTVMWTIKNNGNEDWVQKVDADHPEASDFDFMMLSGTAFELEYNPNPPNLPYRYNFPADPPIITHGMTVDLVINHPALIAPNEPGNYKSTWTIVISSNIKFCKMTFRISVQ
jgi:hypothetical protein